MHVVGRISVEMGYITQKKAVLLNPSVDPKNTLIEWVGEHVNFKNNLKCVLREEVVQKYEPILNYISIPQLVLLDEADELLDARESQKILNQHFKVVMFKGGSHRFSHMPESLEIIQKFHQE
jgi:uncharacterized protein